MERRWVNKNVDLQLLTDSIVEFLKLLNFRIVSGKTASGYDIFAGDSPDFRINGYVSVAIQGKPEDFTVKLELHEAEKKSSFFLSPLLMTMFGAGYFVSKRFQSEDAWMKFEREFWKHLENILAQLTYSSSSSADR